MSYEKLEIVPFGEQLITSWDLDPMYLALAHAGLPQGVLKRFLLAYWCCYHAGAASYLAEQDNAEFWTQLSALAENKLPAPTGGRWPRGHERRHFRGAAAITAVAKLRERYISPQDVVDYVTEPESASEIIKRVKEHYLFGPWIAFKVADMAAQVLGRKVSFEQAHVFMFKDPVEGALRYWRRKNGLGEEALPDHLPTMIADVVRELTVEFSHLKAPPRFDRAPGLLEVETVLCKHKSHENGHYPPFNDTIEISKGLLSWQNCSTIATTLLGGMPKVDNGTTKA